MERRNSMGQTVNDHETPPLEEQQAYYLASLSQ